jgi:probable rRNA maturation factor
MSPPPPDALLLTLELSTPPGVDLPLTHSRLEELVQSILARELGPGTYTLALHFVDDDEIRSLNKEHLGKDSHTDVLSFPLHDPNGMRFVLPPDAPANLGDVVVSIPRAQEQAREFGHSVERELGYLVAHGVLHMLGYDHEEEAERRRMRQQEEAALAPLGLTR